MKLQTLMVIFIIILIPLLVIFTHYTSLQRQTIKLQTDYDAKLTRSIRQAVEAFEVNTVEWNESISRYAESKRRDILASINAFTTSFANSLNVAGTTKESILSYIPAIMYNLYDGFYIYTPTYSPVILTDEDGNAVAPEEGNLISLNGKEDAIVYYECADPSRADGRINIRRKRNSTIYIR